MRIKYWLALSVVVGLSGCAVAKTYVATGGSRADGTISLSYDYGPFERPEVSEAQGLAEAKQRCAVWGYSNADAFGGVMETCSLYDGFGRCGRRLITKNYQCTGSAAP